MEQMALRCPNAVPIRGIQFKHFKLIFRHVADITAEEDAVINLGVWDITQECEEALDRYEGYPNLYNKMFVEFDGDQYMTYTMNESGIAPPSDSYYETIEQGYADFGFDTKLLEQAKMLSIKRSLIERDYVTRY
tara:strand:+ start:95 stop:496 length:402 start_codon:yes stop_codon:yes gene_type:complete